MGGRWTLLIVRELLMLDPLQRVERALPRISRALLAERLRRLEREGLLERLVDEKGRAKAYRLTPAGRAPARTHRRPS